MSYINFNTGYVCVCVVCVQYLKIEERRSQGKGKKDREWSEEADKNKSEDATMKSISLYTNQEFIFLKKK